MRRRSRISWRQWRETVSITGHTFVTPDTEADTAQIMYIQQSDKKVSQINWKSTQRSNQITNEK
jgi:hypothetical protein